MNLELLSDSEARHLLMKEQIRLLEAEVGDPVEELSKIELEITRRRVLESQRAFVEYFWDVVEDPEKIPLAWNWHLDELCSVLDDVISGRIMKTIINVPPGTMKSLLVSVFFRARVWAKDPTKRFLAGSYGGHLSIRDNIKLRTIVMSPKFQALFPEVQLIAEGKEKIENTKGGWSLATSVGGVGTGEHPDFTIIDDPLTEQQSRSEAERRAAIAWIDRTLSTRGVTRDMRTILIMQRLHEDDPTGHLKTMPEWTHVVFPMRYEGRIEHPDGRVEEPDPRDRRSRKGELLWPELFPERKVRALEIALGPYAAAGQLQQRPAPEGGGLFKREWFRFVEAAPVVARRARGWDTAATEDGTADRTATCLISEKADRFFIEHAKGEWLSPAGVDAWMLQVAREDGIKVVQRELREPAASGKTVIAARTKLLKGYDHAGVSVSGDKVTMAKPLRAQVEAGNVYIVRTGDPVRDAWIGEFISELCDFPTGKRDDLVDAASSAFNAVLLEPVPDEGEFVTW